VYNLDQQLRDCNAQIRQLRKRKRRLKQRRTRQARRQEAVWHEFEHEGDREERAINEALARNPVPRYPWLDWCP